MQNIVTHIGEPNIIYCHVAQEQHKDGTPHLHIGLWCRESIRTRDANFWDFVVGGDSHGNYQGMKYPKGVFQYISKDDKDPVTFGVPPPQILTTKASGKTEQVAMMILDGVSNAKLLDLFPSFMLMNAHRVKSFKHLARVYRSEKKQFPKEGCQYIGEVAGMFQIANWINDNLGRKRTFKQEQLFLWGPKNCLKTSLVRFIAEFVSTYDFPTTEQFYDFYDDDEFDLIFIDEFYGTALPLQAYNLWLQGAPMTVRIKGGQAMKFKNQPIITCANYTPRECYPNVTNQLALEAMECRLIVVNVMAPLDLDNLYIGGKNWKGLLLPSSESTDTTDIASPTAEAVEALEVLSTVIGEESVATPVTLEDDVLIFDDGDSDIPAPPPSLFNANKARAKRAKKYKTSHFLHDQAELSGSDVSSDEDSEDISDTEKALLAAFIEDDD